MEPQVVTFPDGRVYKVVDLDGVTLSPEALHAALAPARQECERTNEVIVMLGSSKAINSFRRILMKACLYLILVKPPSYDEASPERRVALLEEPLTRQYLRNWYYEGDFLD